MTEWSQAQDGAGWRLIHDNCLDILPTLEAGSVDCIICDPPYGTTACAWDSVIPFEPMWAGIKHVIKRNAAVVLFGSQPFTSALVMSNPKWFRYQWVWDKVNRNTNYGNAKIMPLRRHEDILVFSSGAALYNPQMVAGAPYIAKRSGGRPGVYANGGLYPKDGFNEGVRYPVSILAVSADVKTEMGLHPTQKPVALLEYLIRTYTNEGETVLDFTCGSGSTGVAALNTGRRFIGIEKDEHYYNVARQRLERASQQLRMAV